MKVTQLTLGALWADEPANIVVMPRSELNALLDSQEACLSPTHIASLLSIKSRTVRDWIKSGRLRAISINGYYRVERKDLQEYLDKHGTAPQRAGMKRALHGNK